MPCSRLDDADISTVGRVFDPAAMDGVANDDGGPSLGVPAGSETRSARAASSDCGSSQPVAAAGSETRPTEVALRFNLWDFGGQDLYHGSHTLFLKGRRAVFLVLWNPQHETGAVDDGTGRMLPRHPLYWLDYIRHLAGTKVPVIVVQSQCDDRAAVVPPARRPQVDVSDFTNRRWIEYSARTRRGQADLDAALQWAIEGLLADAPLGEIGRGRAELRRRLRALQEADSRLDKPHRRHRRMTVADFEALCADVGDVSSPGALLSFLHETGVVFHDERRKLFDDWIILDQTWALDAIYAVFDRARVVPSLRNAGRFTLEDLDALVWREKGHTPDEQRLFLEMMQSCRICFPTRKISAKHEWSARYEYIAPELLPERAGVEYLLAGRTEDRPDISAEAEFPFLHDGIVRELLCRIGEGAGDAAVWWKTGCWFLEETTGSRIFDFMRRIARAERLVVAISAKYLASWYCMRKLLGAYACSEHEDADFCRRVTPLVVDGIDIASDAALAPFKDLWKRRLGKLEDTPGSNAAKTRFARKLVKRWDRLFDAVASISRPFTLDDARRDDFAAVRRMLERGRNGRS